MPWLIAAANQEIVLLRFLLIMKASEAGGYYKEQIAKIAPLMAGPPTVEHVEVTVRELARWSSLDACP